MKHFFFLDNSDLFVRILDLSEADLQRKASEVSLYRIQAKLERCSNLETTYFLTLSNSI